VIVSVSSGKGGTGKTLVATSLALSLKNQRAVQLLDCDVEEPDAHLLLRPSFLEKESVSTPVPEVDEARCVYCGKCAEVCAYNAIAVVSGKVLIFPELCHGCGACSRLCPEKALFEVERELGVVEAGEADGIQFVQGRLNVGEAIATPIVRAVKKHVNPEKLTIIDVAPGTSCPVVEAVRGSDFSIMVTEPTPFGLNDLALAAGMLDELKIPYGVIINRDGVGDSSVEEYCLEGGIPVLMRIPLDAEIARLYSRGISLASGIPEWRQEFGKLMDRVEEVMAK